MKEQKKEESVFVDPEVLRMVITAWSEGRIKQESHQDYMARADKYWDDIEKGVSPTEPQEYVKYTVK